MEPDSSTHPDLKRRSAAPPRKACLHRHTCPEAASYTSSTGSVSVHDRRRRTSASASNQPEVAKAFIKFMADPVNAALVRKVDMEAPLKLITGPADHGRCG
jgi:hypothetical protein